MILADTSAWIEFLRRTGSRVNARMVDAIRGDELATTDMVRMEVLAGARDDRHLDQLRRLLARATHLSTEPIDFEAAASLYRTCRRAGETVRQLTDCLIAAQAVRSGIPVLHADADYDVLARHTVLELDI